MRMFTWLRRALGGGAAAPGSFDPLGTVDLPAPPAVPVGGRRLVYGVVSTVGNYREQNEDNYFVPGRPSLRNGPPAAPGRGDESTVEEGGSGGPSGLFIVADGMGGQQAGEKASQMAVEYIPRELAQRLGSSDDVKGTQEAIRSAVGAANREIVALSNLGAEYLHMGTTVVLALFRNDVAFVTGLGDSRAYRLRDGKIEQLTKDHTLAKALIEAGTIPPEEEETHKFKHILYNYLGSKEVGDGPDQVRVIDVRPGDRFLLCSDGLTGVVKEDTLVELLRGGDDPQRIAQSLVNRALENLSKDNITCVVILVL